MDHVDVGAANRIERSCLMLAILEISFFMRIERVRQQFADISPEIVRSLQGE
jgi:uncharacterized membrane protein